MMGVLVGWLYVVGLVVFLLGLMASIALHELGHLVPAKRFGIRVTQYMVGFGPTLWSRRGGETEYGIKWIPLGGYIRMIGMLPPRPGDDPAKLRSTSTGPFQGLIETARQASLEEIRPGDENRVFYRKPWWQKVIVMTGGPAMNFVLAFVLFAIVLMGFGVMTAKPVINEVSACVTTTKTNEKCTESDPPSPAAAAGLRPGDRIVSIAGQQVTTWDEASSAIRAQQAGPVRIGVERDGRPLTLTANLITQEQESPDRPGTTETVGFLGVTPVVETERQSLWDVGAHMADLTGRTAVALANLPARMVDVWEAAFSGAERDRDGPIGVVGASRIGGEVAMLNIPVENKVAFFINLLAGFNLAVGMFNLIPLLPLDGGHIAGGLWEGLKRGFARITRRPMPGHVDIAKALPLTYAMALIMIVMATLLVYADLVNPVRLTE